MPIFFIAVLALSFLLLMMVFRSLLVPLKAVIMNMLSIGAAYGIVVMVFQWGWGASLFNTAGGPIEPFIPMMMFAIVFGLSMDYEVFLLSRVKEEYDRTGDAASTPSPMVSPLTARVITAAAAIMVVVFGSFVLEDDRDHQAVRARPVVGGVPRRDPRAHAARAGDDGAARRHELVAAALARPSPADAQRRGRHPRLGRLARPRRRAAAKELVDA